MERWRRISGWPMYEVSDKGKVRRGNRLLKPICQDASKGRGSPFVVSLSKPGRVAQVKIAVLVLIAFRKQLRKKNLQALHKNDETSDNKLVNLYWGTSKQNGSDRIKNGRSRRGATNGNSKLKIAQVSYIRRCYRRYSRTSGAGVLSRKFGVHISQIWNIMNGKSWRYHAR